MLVWLLLHLTALPCYSGGNCFDDWCGYFCPRGGRSFDDWAYHGTAMTASDFSDITRGGPSGAEAAIQARPILLPMQK